MKADRNQRGGSDCTCCSDDGPCTEKHRRRQVLDRRRFLAIGSGCVLGALGATTAEAADKSAAVDIGKLKDFAEDGISEAFVKHEFFVIRDDGRLFAASTTCPHKGNSLHKDQDDSSRIVCDGHGSTFNASGTVAIGPATSGLVRLGIAVNAEGHVIVNPREEFPQDNWSDAKSYIDVK